MSQKVLVKLTFGSLPEPKFSRASIVTSAVGNVFVLGAILFLAATATHHIRQQRLNAITLYAPKVAPIPPPPIRIKVIAPPAPKVEEPRVELPTLQAPKIRIEKAEQRPDVRPIAMADVSMPVLSKHSETPRIVLAPQVATAIKQPAQQGQESQRGSVGSSQFGTSASQGQKASAQVKTAAAGWPGFGSGTGGTQRAAAPIFHPIEVMAGPLPEYTPEAKQLRIQGAVVLRVSVSPAGHITVLEVIRGLGHGLDEAAKRAVVQYRIKPALRDGVPVEQVTNITVSFQLS